MARGVARSGWGMARLWGYMSQREKLIRMQLLTIQTQIDAVHILCKAGEQKHQFKPQMVRTTERTLQGTMYCQPTGRPNYLSKWLGVRTVVPSKGLSKVERMHWCEHQVHMTTRLRSRLESNGTVVKGALDLRRACCGVVIGATRPWHTKWRTIKWLLLLHPQALKVCVRRCIDMEWNVFAHKNPGISWGISTKYPPESCKSIPQTILWRRLAK